jgi:hypothetical protein
MGKKYGFKTIPKHPPSKATEIPKQTPGKIIGRRTPRHNPTKAALMDKI